MIQHVFTPSATTLASHPALSALSYNMRINSAPIPKVGDKEQVATINVGHTDASSPNRILPNTGESIGGGFFYQGKWKMIGVRFDGIGNLLGVSPLYSQKCISYKYKQGNSNFEGFFCPINSGSVGITSVLTIRGFNFPSSLGVKIPANSYGGWSSNDGLMRGQKEDVQPGNSMDVGLLQIENGYEPYIQKGWNEQSLEWKFRTTNLIPDGGAVLVEFGLGTLWPFTFRIDAVCELRASSAVRKVVHTCGIQVIQDTSVQFTLNCGGCAGFESDSYSLIQYGISMPFQEQPSPFGYRLSTILSSGELIDRSDSVLLQFNNSAEQGFIRIPSVEFQFMNSMARGRFDMQFTLNVRGLLKNSQLQIDLSMLTNQNTFSLMHCMVYESDWESSFDFSQIQGDVLSGIILVPRFDLPPKTYWLRCLNVVTPIAYAQPAVRVFHSTTLLYTTLAPIPVLTFLNAAEAIDPQGFQMFKTVLQAHALLTISFSMTFKFLINSQASIYVNFPHYYNSYDNGKSLSCKLNGEKAYCHYLSERTIILKIFSIEVQPLNSFSILIYGIQQPPQQYSGGRIYIMGDEDNDPSEIRQSGFLMDMAPANADTFSQSFIIQGFEQSNSFIREQSTYTFYGKTTGSITTNQYLFIDFPQVFGQLLELKPPAGCSITSLDEVPVKFSQICSTQGNRVALKLETVIAGATTFKIDLLGLTNPEQSLCNVQKPIISQIATDNSTVIARSTIASANIQNYKFQLNPNLNYVYWYQNENDLTSPIQSSLDPSILRLNYHRISLIPGQYSQFVGIGQIARAFDKSMQFKLNSNQGTFKTLSNLIIYPGWPKLTLNLGCLSTTFPQTYYIGLTKEENDTIKYADVGLLAVDVVNEKTTISSQYQSYSIPVLRHSLPLIFDFSKSIPLTNLVIQFNIQADEITTPPGFVFKESQRAQLSVIINDSHYRHQIQIQQTSNITAVTATHTATMKVIFDGPSAPYYEAADVQLILKPSTPRQAVIFSMTLDNYAAYPNKHLINFQTSHPVIIYYYVSLQNSPPRSLEYVKQQVDLLYTLQPNDYFQEQFGSLVIQDEINEAYPWTITGLRARQWYTITSWAVDQYDDWFSADPKDFVTESNNGRLIKLPMIFSQPPSNDLKQSIACWLCTQFQYPCFNVMTFDKIYCNNQTDVSMAFNGTNDRKVSTPRELQQQIPATSQGVSDLELYQLAYYFIPNRFLNIDETWKPIFNGQRYSSIQYAFQSALDPSFKDYFITNFSTEAHLVDILAPHEVITTIPPIISSMPNLTSGETWVNIENIKLRANTGIVWGYIISKFNDSGIAINAEMPTTMQLKYMADNLNQSISNIFIKLYTGKVYDINQLLNFKQVSHNFTELEQARWYRVYVMATEDNPDLWAQTSTIYQYEIKTQRTPFDPPAFELKAIVLIGSIILSLLMV